MSPEMAPKFGHRDVKGTSEHIKLSKKGPKKCIGISCPYNDLPCTQFGISLYTNSLFLTHLITLSPVRLKPGEHASVTFCPYLTLKSVKLFSSMLAKFGSPSHFSERRKLNVQHTTSCNNCTVGKW